MIHRQSLPRRGVLLGASAATLMARKAAADEPASAVGRPETDFVQCQAVPGILLPPTGSKPGTEGVPLSYDAKGTRAVTQILRFPAGWSQDADHYIDSDEEFYVLSGAILIDGTSYRAGDYAFLPNGYRRRHQASPEGAVVLFYYDGEHRAIAGPPPPGLFRRERMIPRVKTSSLRWSRAPADCGAWGPHARAKVLRRDRSGEMTWLLQVPADTADVRRPAVVNEAVEEFFLLEGTVTSTRGTMRAGAYAWRVPQKPHGPYGTRTGFTALVRSVGGAPQPHAAGAPQSVVWEAAYDPAIPEVQKRWAFAPITRQGF